MNIILQNKLINLDANVCLIVCCPLSLLQCPYTTGSTGRTVQHRVVSTLYPSSLLPSPRVIFCWIQVPYNTDRKKGNAEINNERTITQYCAVVGYYIQYLYCISFVLYPCVYPYLQLYVLYCLFAKNGTLFLVLTPSGGGCFAKTCTDIRHTTVCPFCNKNQPKPCGTDT
jgi:hypothetical protein